MVLEQEYTKVEVGRSLEISPNLITRWIQQHQAKLPQELEQVSALKAQVKSLQMVKDIKKTTVIVNADSKLTHFGLKTPIQI